MTFLIGLAAVVDGLVTTVGERFLYFIVKMFSAVPKITEKLNATCNSSEGLKQQ